MLSKLLLTAALTALPLCALADDANLLAVYWADSGSLPPEYAWDTKVSITTDGKLTLVYCIGYATDGPDCKTRKAKVDEAHRAAILAAIADGNLVAKPARKTDDIPVGGSANGGKAFVDGQPVALPAFPVEEDAARVAAVLHSIEAAIPDRFRSRYFTRN